MFRTYEKRCTAHILRKNRMKILIVDDDHISTSLLLSYLEDIGECDTANSGNEALEAVQRAMQNGTPYNFICLDILMPDIDGHETLRTIRELEASTFNVSGKKAKIIMVSTLDDVDTIRNSFKQMCDGYLTKPIKKNDILHHVEDFQ